MAEESKLQGQIIKYLEGLGAYVINVIVSNRAGTHDIVFCLKGQFHAVEVKVDYNKPSALQLAKRREVEAAGGKVLIVWTLAEVKKVMRQHQSKGTRGSRTLLDVPLL